MMRLHYLDWGNDGAPPLQLISWDPYAAYAMADFVYDIAQLVRPTRTAPVRIVAHSLGGNVAPALRRYLSRRSGADGIDRRLRTTLGT